MNYNGFSIITLIKGLFGTTPFRSFKQRPSKVSLLLDLAVYLNKRIDTSSYIVYLNTTVVGS